MNVIEKKSWPEHFEKVLSGEKKIELRIADFEISQGDKIVLKEYNPETKQYTGREAAKTAASITRIPNLLKMYKAEELEKHGVVIIRLEDEK